MSNSPSSSSSSESLPPLIDVADSIDLQSPPRTYFFSVMEFFLSIHTYFFSVVEFLFSLLSYFFTAIRVFFGTPTSEDSVEDFIDAEASLSPSSEYFDAVESLSPQTVQPAAPPQIVQPAAQTQSAQTPPVERTYFPWLILSFVVIHGVIFISTMYINNCPKDTYPLKACFPTIFGRFGFQSTEQNPLLGPTRATLIKMGGLYLRKALHVHEAWRLFSNVWLHDGVYPLIADIVGILGVGVPLEQKFGFVRIGLLYFISSLGGSLISALFIQSGVTVGASGALAGLTGGTISKTFLEHWTLGLKKGVDLTIAIAVMVLNVVLTILQHGDNFSNLGGMLFGLSFGFVILRRPVNRVHCITVSLVAFVGLLIGIVALLKGVDLNDHCSWCRYLDCVPFPNWTCKYRGIDCQSNENGKSLSMTCKGNGKSGTFPLTNGIPPRPIEDLCFLLCGA